MIDNDVQLGTNEPGIKNRQVELFMDDFKTNEKVTDLAEMRTADDERSEVAIVVSGKENL